MLPSRTTMQTRRASADKMLGAPRSYDPKAHTFEAVISVGAPVTRAYGVEVLRISRDAVDLSRLHEGGIPLLDHHSQAGIDQMLGRLVDAWFDGGALVGKFKLNQTEQGRKAEGMISRNEVTALSAGYRVDEWSVTDADGDVVDERNVSWDDNLIFTATKWQLFEASLVGVPADAASMIRSMSGSDPVLTDTLARMKARQSIVDRSSFDPETIRIKMRMRSRMAGSGHG